MLLHSLSKHFRTERPSIQAEYRGVQSASATTNMPGALNLIFFPFEAASSVGVIRRAHHIRDQETLIDGILRVVSIPFMAGNGIGMSCDFMARIFLIQPAALAVTSLVGSIAGIALCSLEILVEGLSFIQAKLFESQITTPLIHMLQRKQIKTPDQLRSFIRTLHTNLSENKQAHIEIFGKKPYEKFLSELESKINRINRKTDVPAEIKDIETLLIGISLSYIQSKYLQLDPVEQKEVVQEILEKHPEESIDQLSTRIREKKEALLAGRHSLLSRRIGKWLTKELDENMYTTLKKLSTASKEELPKAIEEASSLLKKIHMQVQKKKIVHMVGLLCLGVLIGAVSASTGGASLGLVAGLYVLGFTLALVRYGLYKGWFKSRTWTFELNRVTPTYIRKCFRKKQQPENSIATRRLEPIRQTKIEKKQPTPYLDTYAEWKKLDTRVQAYI